MLDKKCQELAEVGLFLAGVQQKTNDLKIIY